MKKILVANRGEIAIRVMKTCKRLGIKTVAVYSDADRTAPHVKFADEAIHLGPAAASESYLKGDKIVALAKQNEVDGIHPGYGFLSENAAFANLVIDAGMIFIGPGKFAIETMGSKLAAKAAVADYDIPMVPGTDKAITDIAEAKKEADKIGFPILIKASAGGGGKGMRIVDNQASFEEQMQLAVSEATSAFGDGSVFIEKYITNPRHIEFQILGDNHGNVVHLFERECSIQRRHQKVIEEAPSVVLTEALREKMGKAATDVARAVNYSGAGTVEFLLNGEEFYFLEMNTRLQVEHPVTEMITGIDLVEEQIKIANNEPLSFKQDDLKIEGHSFELRVYAEDPVNNFLPDIGTLETYKIPQGKGIRVDDGLREGMTIPIYYDPMIAKLVSYGSDRNEAIKIMLQAISNYKIEGVKTTLEFGAWALQHPKFISGEISTNFIKEYFTPEMLSNSLTDEEMKVGAVAAVRALELARKEIRTYQG